MPSGSTMHQTMNRKGNAPPMDDTVFTGAWPNIDLDDIGLGDLDDIDTSDLSLLDTGCYMPISKSHEIEPCSSGTIIQDFDNFWPSNSSCYNMPAMRPSLAMSSDTSCFPSLESSPATTTIECALSSSFYSTTEFLYGQYRRDLSYDDISASGHSFGISSDMNSFPLLENSPAIASIDCALPSSAYLMPELSFGQCLSQQSYANSLPSMESSPATTCLDYTPSPGVHSVTDIPCNRYPSHQGHQYQLMDEPQHGRPLRPAPTSGFHPSAPMAEPKIKKTSKKPKKVKLSKCQVCGRRRPSRDIKRHMRVHHPEEADAINIPKGPYPCTNCSKEFTRKDNMVKHRKKNKCHKAR